MRNSIVFNNKNSMDFGLYISGGGTYGAPARKYETVAVPGRNGLLYIDEQAYDNVEVTYKGSFIYENFDRNMLGLRSWLLSSTGYGRLEDTYHPDEYRMAVFKGPISPDVWYDLSEGQFDLTFDCKPQRFLKSGEPDYPINQNCVIFNPTSFEALPLIKTWGTGTFSINGIKCTISADYRPTYIDSELQTAYGGSAVKVNCNNYLTLADKVFPSLKAGANEIDLGDLTRMTITPRWWQL